MRSPPEIILYFNPIPIPTPTPKKNLLIAD